MRLRGQKGPFKFLRHETAQIFPGVIPRAVCEEARNTIDQVLDRGDNNRIWRDATGSDSRILGFEKDIPALLPYFYVESCISAIDSYLGKSTQSWLLMANRLIPRSGNKGSGGGLHRDSPFSHQVKCIWYLSDVHAANGPFEYVPGSHRNLYSQRNKYPIGTYRFENVSEERKAITAEAGSLLVCDTRAIHGGRPIAEGSRYAVTLYTFDDATGADRLFRSSGLKPD
ncbi:phytanoyl-CoA dioxygenase family protein [Pelagerythrobacter rhizovicinus]